MKNGIPNEMYYFLLEWKDKNLHEFISEYGEVSLDSLSTYSLRMMFRKITFRGGELSWGQLVTKNKSEMTKEQFQVWMNFLD
jgi:hypothetical protein